MRETVKVRVRHVIQVEPCIADEVKSLNNDHNIVTLYSCCGHHVGKPWVKVKSDDIEKMKALGYKPLGTEQVWIYKFSDRGGRRIQTAVEQVFQLRSKCKCAPGPSGAPSERSDASGPSGEEKGDKRRVTKW